MVAVNTWYQRRGVTLHWRQIWWRSGRPGGVHVLSPVWFFLQVILGLLCESIHVARILGLFESKHWDRVAQFWINKKKNITLDNIISRAGYRFDFSDTGAKTILLERYRFLNGAWTDTFSLLLLSLKQSAWIYFVVLAVKVSENVLWVSAFAPFFRMTWAFNIWQFF